MQFSTRLTFVYLLSFTTMLINGMDPFKDLRNLMPEQVIVDIGSHAAGMGDFESLKNIINKTNINKVTSNNVSVLIAALKFAFKTKDEAKYMPILEHLLSLGAEFQRPLKGTEMSSFGFAISIACLEGYLRPVEILLGKGANPFASCTLDRTTAVMLCLAAKQMDEDHVGADAVLKLFQPKATTLRQAIECLHMDKVLELANPTSVQSPEEYALGATYDLYNNGVTEAFPFFEILFSRGAHPHQIIPETPLSGYTFMLAATSYALKKGDTKLLELCLDHKGDPNYKAFPMAPSAIGLAKGAALCEPNNTNLPKVRALLQQ